MLQTIRLGVFLGFLVLGLLAASSAPRVCRLSRSARVNLFLVYVLSITTTVGFSQRESWPFTNWALVHHLAPREVSGRIELEMVDADGRAYPADHRIWQPLAPEELYTWLQRYFAALDDAGRINLARFMVARAEAARVRLQRGEPVGTNGWVLGPLAAPYHFQARVQWRSPSHVPPTPFVGVRVWEVSWNVEERLADPRRVVRRLLVELDGRPAR